MDAAPLITGWDRFLLGFAPKYALERIRARSVAAALSNVSRISARHYEAATQGRRTQGWARNATDADLTIGAALVELRMHSRDLIRNNAWARRGQKVVANNTIGWGIVPKATGPNPTANTKAGELWNAWAGSTECASEGRHTFYGVQHLVMRHIFADGEVLIRRRYRRERDNLTIPLQLQVLEADYLDHQKMALSSLAGGPIIRGVEYDLLGRRDAYWLFEKHPGSGRNVTPSRRIPAEEVIHVFEEERSGQSRGVSWLAAAIVNMKDLDEYDDAELVAKKIAACFAAFVTDDGQGTAIGEQDKVDPLVESFEPGMITQLPAGKTVTFGSPPPAGADNLPTRTLRRIAAAIGVTYEDLTGDYSNVNFSSARMARLSHWGNVHQWQENMIIPLLCGPVWAWAMEAAINAGELPGTVETAPGSDWTCPPMPMLEPDKEGLGITRLVRAGVMTYSQMIREQGGDPETHWAEYEADQKRLDAGKIQLDSDVRAVSQAGLTQVRAGAGGAPPAPGDKPTDKADA